MPQDVSTNQGVREPLASPPPIQPWSAETEADKLMDELFSDIDRMLEGGSKLPTEPVKPEYVSLKPILIPQIAMPPAVVLPQELVGQPNPEPADTKPVEPSEPPVVSPAPRTERRSGWSFEKFLLAGGIASLIVTIILLLVSQKKLSWPWSQNLTGSSSAPKSKLSDSDSQFANYMVRSLDVIDHKAKAKQQKSPAAGSSGTTSSQPIPASGNRTVALNQPPTVLERVYIPVPQSQMPSALSAPPAAARPSIPAPAARPPIPAPSAASAPPAAARPAIPAPSTAARPAIPAPSTAAARPSAPISPQPTTAGTTAAVTPAAVPSVKPTLVGLLELGDRSAALFEINGITQRISIGEAIGPSGWTLVSVANQEAVVRRNGEVRSVYVGQKF